MPFYGPAGAAGATIELDNLGTVAINTSLISDTDSTDDLGSSSVAWDQLYVDDIQNTAGDFGRIDMNNSSFIAIVWEGSDVKAFLIRSQLEVAPGGTSRFLVTTEIIAKANLRPNSDSTFILGRNTAFWSDTYTDRLFLTNIGAPAAAADKVNISAIDLSAGNTMLDIDLEGTGAIFNSTDNTVTDKMAIGINGTTYYIMLTTSNA